jgi:intracellular multiplication protein IcmD
MLKSINKTFATAGAAFTMGLMTMGDAHATGTSGQGFNAVADKIVGGISGLPGLVTALSYMMGLLFAVLGVLKIKDHVENPTQTQLKDGAIRLAVGGALFAIPMLTTAMNELVNTGKAQSAPGTLKAVEFKVQ